MADYHLRTKGGKFPLCTMGATMTELGLTCGQSDETRGREALAKLTAKGYDFELADGECPEILNATQAVQDRLAAEDRMRDLAAVAESLLVSLSLNQIELVNYGGDASQAVIDRLDELVDQDLRDRDGEDETYYEDNLSDVEADAMTLASAGMGTDEDYGYFGGDDGY